jgi:uncharacterized protein YihD (DUF1040 family)
VKKVKVDFSEIKRLVNKLLTCPDRYWKKNPKRIDKMLDLITEIWKENPDFRLCQLIGNCFEASKDIYYIEDNELETKLKEVYNVRKRKSCNTKGKKNS